MDDIVLKAKIRDVIGKQVRALRRAGLVPAVIYGHNIQPLAISLNAKETTSLLHGVSSSRLIAVELDGKKHMVLVREKQRNPVTGAYVHLDFQEVSMTEKLRVTVAIVMVGESPAVKNYNGVIVTTQESLDVECLPQDLIDRIEVDLGQLKEIGDTLYVRDLNIPAAITVLEDPNETVVLVTPPLSDAQIGGIEGEAVAEPEVIERGKKEEEDF